MDKRDQLYGWKIHFWWLKQKTVIYDILNEFSDIYY